MNKRYIALFIFFGIYIYLSYYSLSTAFMPFHEVTILTCYSNNTYVYSYNITGYLSNSMLSRINYDDFLYAQGLSISFMILVGLLFLELSFLIFIEHRYRKLRNESRDSLSCGGFIVILLGLINLGLTLGFLATNKASSYINYAVENCGLVHSGFKTTTGNLSDLNLSLILTTIFTPAMFVLHGIIYINLEYIPICLPIDEETL